MFGEVQFDIDLIKRYDQSGPRYTSYPTAVSFTDDFTEADYRAAAKASNKGKGPLSLYFHIPFCDTVCFYCACNKIATKDHSLAGDYLSRLYREIEMQAIYAALERHDGNKPKVADELGISLKTLYNKLNQTGTLRKSA